MKKILVLFATVVVMMMVTGCENPASIPANVPSHIPTQEELWVAEGYRYCGDVVNENDNSYIESFFNTSKCKFKLTEDGKYYVKFPLNKEKIDECTDWLEEYDFLTGYGRTLASSTRVKVHKNGSEVDSLVIEPRPQLY